MLRECVAKVFLLVRGTSSLVVSSSDLRPLLVGLQCWINLCKYGGALPCMHL